MNLSPHQQAFTRIRAEYLEMPGMSLTIEQAQRLCGVEGGGVCERVLDELVKTKFLWQAVDGRYMRLTDDCTSRPRPANAALTLIVPVKASRHAS